MHECLVTDKIMDELPQAQNPVDEYVSVEISSKHINFSYHFKLWNVASMPMCILVNEKSQILLHLSEGDTFNMKYYASNPIFPAEFRQTAIRHITKDDKGRFKGHYLVQLEILDNQEREMARRIQTSH